jgi:predicted secreted protein
MASSGRAAKGTLLIWNSFPVFELTSISPSLGEVAEVDITNHDSQGSYEESADGLLSGGDFSLEANFLPGDTNGQVAMMTDHQARTARAFRICSPEGVYTLEGTALIAGFKVTGPVTGKLGMTATLRPTGPCTGRTTASAGLTTPFFALRDQSSNSVTPTPAASGSVYEFRAVLDAGDTAIAVQPTASAGAIRVNGVSVTSGSWSDDITVASGSTKLVIIEVKETEKTSMIYRLYVKRPVS